MPTVLDTPYADTRADALSFALGLAPLDALAVRTVERSGHAVELRLLGASHQVIVGAFSETVACLDDPAARPLPGRARDAVAGWDYDFRADTLTHPGDRGLGHRRDRHPRVVLHLGGGG
ncbi:DUF2617 family protein, partial [Actinomadura kijaniata]|uniref:DUF2617 family protein n=1 Tax=Actinomadura kijaniata TaxID=46161 RepID=UPI003F1AAA6D